MNLGFLLLVAVFAPALTAVASLVLPVRNAACFHRIAAAATLISLAAILVLFFGCAAGAGGLACRVRADWIPEIGAHFDLGVDGLSLPLLLLAGLVNMAGVLAGGRQRERQKEYYALYLLLASGALLAITALDLLLFYIGLEIDVLCSFLLIACWGDFKDAPTLRTTNSAALMLTLFLAAGALLVTLGVWTIYQAGGHTFDLLVLRERLTAQPLALAAQSRIFLLLLAGFGILMSVWPLHVWAPAGYAAAPTGISMLSAGVLKTLGAYGLIRVAVPLLPDGARAWSGLMAGLALVNILYCGWITMRQTDWKFLLAYSSISHMGYVLLGIAAVSPLGSAGAVTILFAHGLSAAVAFALIGQVETATGTRAVAGMSGLARSFAFTGPAMLLTAFAICGLPGFASFWGEILVFVGAWQQGSLPFRLAAVAAVWGLVLTATYMLGAIRTSFFGPTHPEAGPHAEQSTPAFRLACALLLAASMIVGFAPRILTDQAVHSTLGPNTGGHTR